MTADLQVPTVYASEGAVYEGIEPVKGVGGHVDFLVCECLRDYLMTLDPTSWLQVSIMTLNLSFTAEDFANYSLKSSRNDSLWVAHGL